jgi:Uma2 family endonuclease
MNDNLLQDVPPESNTELLEEDRRSEWLEDQRRERMMGAKAGLVAASVTRLLGDHAEAQQGGFVFSADGGYRIFPHAPRLVRYPDVSFIRRGRLPNDEPPDGLLQIVPDLVVEVVSPNDLAEDVEIRVTDSVRVGVPLIWVIYPNARCVRVLRQGASAPVLFETDELQGGDVLPGFSCRVAQLLPRK